MSKSTAKSDVDNSMPPLGGAILELGSVVLDVNDIELEAAFWSALLGEEPGPL